jgi:predicted metal-dependent hydrolase
MNLFDLADCTVTRSTRRSIALRVGPEGGIEVKAPQKCSDNDILDCLVKHQSWLQKRLLKHQQIQQEAPEHKFAEGETFLYLGRKYMLTFVKGRSDADFEDDRLECRPGPAVFTRKMLLKLYQRDARAYLIERTMELAEEHSFKVEQVKINNAARRWGSCSGKGNINFSWRLIMCPPETIDYVICHELAHLNELNHSTRFWTGVEKICPDCKIHRKELRQNEHLYNGF